MSATEEFKQSLRDALRYSSGSSVADKLAQGSLLNGVVGADPELFNLYVEEVGPQQAVLDIHLTGEGVKGHSTNASSFAKFVLGLSEAVKETAKDESGAKKASSELLIDGAMPGSVRVVLRAPEVKEVTAIVEETPTSLQSQALRKISQVFSLASSEDEVVSEALDASVHSLPIKARKKLGDAISQALASSWKLEGALEQRKYGVEDITIDSRSAAKLKVALERGHKEPSIERVVGHIDGVKRSSGLMWFKPEKSKMFAATVKDDSLLQRVAEFNALEDQRVVAVFDVLTVSDQGTTTEFRKSRTLLSVETMGFEAELPIDLLS